MNWMTSAKKRVGKTKKSTKKDLLRSKAFEKLNKPTKASRVHYNQPSSLSGPSSRLIQSYDSFKNSTDAVMIGNFARSNENTDMDVVAMQRPAASSSFCDDEQSQFMSPYRQPPRMPDKQEYDPLSALELSSDEENEDEDPKTTDLKKLRPAATSPMHHQPVKVQQESYLEQNVLTPVLTMDLQTPSRKVVANLPCHDHERPSLSSHPPIAAIDLVQAWGLFDGGNKVFDTKPNKHVAKSPVVYHSSVAKDIGGDDDRDDLDELQVSDLL